ncbi:MAG: prepilin-type N-terminal cleavage/methylation domain-containing protein [Lachnospiraceae bacterium]|nr:prepilin-type N-terminal cleavage/methylation domain-containing protein [Lachnospiraceae bacterium]
MEKNRGLSLVELLITVAILSIVLVIAMSFMMTGSRSFTKGNADSTVQKEAELTVNQIEDMIIDINGGVSMTDDAGKTEMTMYHTEDDGTGSLLYTKEAVTWNKSDNNVYCSKWMVNYDDSTDTYVVDASAPDNYVDQLLAEHVTSFDVDLSDTLTTKALDGTTRTIVKSVLVKVGYDDGTGIVDYATSPVITLRNRMLLSDDPADIFDEVTPAADTLKLYYSGVETAGTVPIVDRVSEVQRGAVYTIYAKINTGADVNDLVDWEIDETGTLSTIDSLGYLTVGEFEANAYLTITARYKSNPSKKATGVVKVVGTSALKSFKSVHIATMSWEAFAPQYEAYPVTEGFTQSEEDAITYHWTVKVEGSGRALTDIVQPFTDNEKALALTIIKDPANFGIMLEIMVEAYSDVTGETRTDSVKYRIDKDGAVDGDSSMKRGENNEWLSFVMSDTWAQYYDYDFYFCDVYGNEISAYDSLRSCVELTAISWNAYRLSFTEDLPRDQEYYVKVLGYYWNEWDGLRTDLPTRERIHYIPAVQLYGKTCYSNSTLKVGNFTFDYTMIGYKELALSEGEGGVENSRVTYEIEEFNYTAPEGVVVTAKVVQDEATGTNRVWARGIFECSDDDWAVADQVELKSLKIRITAKGAPSVSTLVTIIFE